MVYPDYSEESDIIICKSKQIRKQVRDLWDKLPTFRDSMTSVPTLHVPNLKHLVRRALSDDDFKVQSKGRCSTFFYPC